MRFQTRSVQVGRIGGDLGLGNVNSLGQLKTRTNSMSLKRDTIYNLLGHGIPLCAAVITIPYLLRVLGNEQFGLLSLIWALIGYFGLFDLGVGRALTYEVSRNQTGNILILKTLVKAGLALTILTGLIGAVAVYFFVAPYTGPWFKLSPERHSAARLAFEVAALGVIPTTLTSGLRGVLEGFSRFWASNISRSVLGTLMFVMPALVTTIRGPDLPAVAASIVAARFLVCGVMLFQLRQFLHGGGTVRRGDVMALLNFGIWVTISGIVSPLMVYGDRFFVSAAVGVGELALYAIPQEGLQRLLLIPAALTMALLPRLSALSDREEIKLHYWRNLLRIAAWMFPILVAASLLAGPILAVWISEEFSDKSAVIVVILCAGLWFNSLAQMPMTLLHALGRPKLAAVAHLIELPVYIAVVMVLSESFGVVGAAIAWSLRVTVDFFIFHYFAKLSLR